LGSFPRPGPEGLPGFVLGYCGLGFGCGFGCGFAGGGVCLVFVIIQVLNFAYSKNGFGLIRNANDLH